MKTSYDLQREKNPKTTQFLFSINERKKCVTWSRQIHSVFMGGWKRVPFSLSSVVMSHCSSAGLPCAVILGSKAGTENHFSSRCRTLARSAVGYLLQLLGINVFKCNY